MTQVLLSRLLNVDYNQKMRKLFESAAESQKKNTANLMLYMYLKQEISVKMEAKMKELVTRERE